MSKRPSKSSRAYLDQYAVSGMISAVDLDITQETPDVVCLSDLGPRVVVGNYAHKHALRGFFNGSDSQLDAIANALRGSTDDHYLLEMFDGTAESSVAYESIVQQAGQPIKAAVGQAILEDIPLDGAGGLTRGLVVRNATLAGTDTGTSIDRGAGGSTTGGATFAAVFRFIAGSHTNAVLQLQHSSDNAIWADTTGLTATSTGNRKAVRTTTTAGINRYLRAIATTVSIGTTDLEVLVTAGVVIGTP